MPNQCLSKCWAKGRHWGSWDGVSVVPQSPPHLGCPALCILGHGCHGDAHLSLQQEHWGLVSSVHCSGFHSSPALSPSSLQAERDHQEQTKGLGWVPFPVGCLPPPHWMGLVLSSTRDPREEQVWKMEHYTSGGKYREEGIRNQPLCPVPLLLPSTSAWPLWWRWRIYSDANPPTAAQIKQQQVRELVPGGIFAVGVSVWSCHGGTCTPQSWQMSLCQRSPGWHRTA